ncbi:Histidyl-tRNA synthetase [Thermodesulfobium narugense DSM 14796]|uniref:Histidine--tRNA ligase n=1 Tax=Thermodesulfobium narugense DSM 14796 TaxID=747365 RepID=M1E866_9BACT|nr:histidine--tRNA ligase [Thermodesulfobium narugense]AEE14993.1 Histidyl-tRNA synthetase [Thermodesulfobium narugense DSM 14796]
MNYKAPKGTFDIFGKKAKIYEKIENVSKKIMNLYGFSQIRTPIFEDAGLFVRSLGETSDVVQKEMYLFKDKGDRLLALRPEGTAPVIRAIIENKLAQNSPIKLFYTGQMFRYERPQAGRFRQFYQFGAEIVGTHDPISDFEIIDSSIKILKELGVEYELHLNSVGCMDCRNVYKEVLLTFLKNHENELCENCKTRMYKNPLRVLDCKEDQCKLITSAAPKITDYLCDGCKIHFEKLQSYLKKFKIEYILDPRLVRGLDYYTKTAFEALNFSLGSQNAVLGGGRYDGLAEELGGKNLPGVGFASGIERLVTILERLDKTYEKEHKFMVIPVTENEFDFALEFLAQLRNFVCSLFPYDYKNLKSSMKLASKLDCDYVVLIGQDEIKNNMISLKNLENGQQKSFSKDEFLNIISNERCNFGL